MAYVAHDVYQNGINSEVFNTTKPVYIALVSAISGSDSDILKSVLAVSELRQGSGSTNETNEQTSTPSISNNVGTFSTKKLSLLSVPYNRTKSVKGDSNFSFCDVNDSNNQSASNVAIGFAIIQFNGAAADLTAYQVDNGGSTTTVKFKGAPITSATGHKVLIVGNLTSNPTINEDSNFMFGGAQITFTEA